MAKDKYAICYDTICSGFTPVIGDVDYETEEIAQKIIDNDRTFYVDCFVCTVSEIGHKTIYRRI